MSTSADEAGGATGTKDKDYFFRRAQSESRGDGELGKEQLRKRLAG